LQNQPSRLKPDARASGPYINTARYRPSHPSDYDHVRRARPTPRGCHLWMLPVLAEQCI